MKNENYFFNEEQRDFLNEMMNIGAGNACTAMQQMLQHPVDLTIPRVHLLTITQVPSIFNGSAMPVACVKMGMVGDVNGGIILILPEEHRDTLCNMMKQATPGFIHLKNANGKTEDISQSVILEIGNIITGVYLTAIHDFCQLNIYHTVPRLAIDMIQAVLDEILIELSCTADMSIVIENEFLIREEPLKVFLLVIPFAESIPVLTDSINAARQAYVPKSN